MHRSAHHTSHKTVTIRQRQRQHHRQRWQPTMCSVAACDSPGPQRSRNVRNATQRNATSNGWMPSRSMGMRGTTSLSRVTKVRRCCARVALRCVAFPSRWQCRAVPSNPAAGVVGPPVGKRTQTPCRSCSCLVPLGVCGCRTSTSTRTVRIGFGVAARRGACVPVRFAICVRVPCGTRAQNTQFVVLVLFVRGTNSRFPRATSTVPPPSMHRTATRARRATHRERGNQERHQERDVAQLLLLLLAVEPIFQLEPFSAVPKQTAVVGTLNHLAWRSLSCSEKNRRGSKRIRKTDAAIERQQLIGPCSS